jgi:tetratricopeptide (TPR) repeat protein
VPRLGPRQLEQAALEERAGQMAYQSGDRAAARVHFERAISLFDLMNETHSSARVAALLGEVDFHELHMTQGIERMEKAFALLSEDEPDADLVTLAAQLGRMQLFSGAPDVASQRIEFALDLAEKLELREQFSQALNTKAVILEFAQRREEALLLVRHSLDVALSDGLSIAALRAYNNLLAFQLGADKLDEMPGVFDAAMNLAQRIGHSTWQEYFLGTETIRCVWTGEWDRAIELVEQCRQAPDVPIFLMQRLVEAMPVYINRGDLDAARELLAAASELEGSEEYQSRSSYSWAKSLVLLAEGRGGEALAAAEEEASVAARVGDVKTTLVNLLDVSFATDQGRCEEILRGVEAMMPGQQAPMLRAQARRMRAKLSPQFADECFEYAIGVFRRVPSRFSLGVTLLEQSESLRSRGRTDEAAAGLDEARSLFENLRATPWIERVRQPGAGSSSG